MAVATAISWMPSSVAGETMLQFKLSGKGDFSADNGNINFYRWLKQNKSAYTKRYRLEYKLKWMAGFCGPVFRPLIGKLARVMRVEESLDLANGSVSDQSTIPNSALGYTRTVRESAGGLLIDVKLARDCFKREANYAYLQWIFNGDILKGRKMVWGNKTVPIPKDIKSGRFLKDSRNTVKTIRFSLTNDIDLCMVFIDGFKNKSLAQGKSRKNMPEIKNVDSVFEMRATMDGLDARYFVILLHPGDKIPALKYILACSRPKLSPIKKGNMLNQGSSFETGPFDGFCSYSRFTHRAPLTRFKPCPQPEIVNDDKVDGKHCLRIPEFGARGVVFNPAKLELGKPYTLSMWMKSEKPKVEITVIIGLRSEAIKKKFFLTTKWKRYSFAFIPKKFAIMGHCPIRVTASKRHRSTFWLDGVQLEEGKLTPYNTAAKLEMGAFVPNEYRLVKVDEPSIVNLYFRNNSNQPARGTISYVVKDYWEKPVKKGIIPVNAIPAKGNSSQILNLGKLPRGYYRVYFTTSWGEHEEAIWGVFSPQKLVKVSPHWPFGAHDICGEDILYRQLGFGWMRNFFGWHMRDVMPKENMPELDFKRADKYLELADKAGINLMPVLEIGFRQKIYSTKHGWMKSWWLSDHLLTKKITRKSYFPKKDIWEKYIYETVRRYKGRITYWEVTNESNCHLYPEEYLELLKIAYIAAKKADPDCKIVGICSTADMGGEPMPYTRKVLELGGWKYLDAVSIHMYGDQPPETHFGGEDKLFQMLKDICAKHGKKITIWNTEKNSASINSGYSTHKFNVPPVQHYHQGRRIPSFKDKGEYFIREGIMTSSVGNGPFFWHCFLPNKTYGSYIAYIGPYMNGPNYFEFDMAPRPELIAVNGFTSLLSPDMKGAGVVDWGEFNRCSLFASNGGTVAAIWNWKSKSMLELTLKDTEFQLYNYFGEPIDVYPDGNGVLKIDLESAPKYLVLPKLTPIEARKVLAKAVFPYTSKFNATLKLGWVKNAPVLRVTLKNNMKTSLDARLTIDSLPQGWSCPQKQQKIKQLAPGKSKTLNFFPLKIIPLPKGDKIVATVKVDKQTEKLETEILPFNSLSQLKGMLDTSGKGIVENRAGKPVKIDGNLSEWRDSPAMWITNSRGDSHWNGVRDSSCKLIMGWDKKNLYFAIRVFDNKIDNTAKLNKMLWNGDAVELLFNLDFADDKPGQDIIGYRMNKDDFHASIAPKTMQSDSAAIWWKYLDNDGSTKIISKLLTDGYVIEGAMPWKSLNKRYSFNPTKGMLIGFTFILSDRDGIVNVKKRLVWHGDQGVNRKPDSWGTLFFK